MSEETPTVVIIIASSDDGSALAELHHQVGKVVQGRPIDDVVNVMLTVAASCIAQQANVEPLDVDKEIDTLAAGLKQAVRHTIMETKGSRQ